MVSRWIIVARLSVVVSDASTDPPSGRVARRDPVRGPCRGLVATAPNNSTGSAITVNSTPYHGVDLTPPIARQPRRNFC